MELPPPPPAEVRFSEYRPGDAAQDLYTLPVESALALGIRYFYTPMAEPLWPFEGESTEKPRNASRHPARPGAYILAGLGALEFLTLSYLEPRFEAWRHVRGFAHSLLWNEILTAAFKYSVQRERPFHDREKAQGTLRADDRMSFYSGHASHVFNFATYSSAMARAYLPNRWLGWGATAGLYGMAAYVGAARAIDGQHNWSDVLVGAFAGSVVGFKINLDVEDLLKEAADVGLSD